MIIKMHLTKIIRCFMLLLVLMSFVSLTIGDISPIIERPTSPFGCHRKLYTYRVTQIDENGRECWDNISVWSCWGRCDSNEISDWKFPYKRSHHPVCVHAGRSKSMAMLRNCQPDTDPAAKKYEYMEAIACNCQACSSDDTSCEGPNQGFDQDMVTSSGRILVMGGPGDDLDLY